jgi:hypothetical protein
VFSKFDKPNLNSYFLGDIYRKIAQKNPLRGVAAPIFFCILEKICTIKNTSYGLHNHDIEI